ncbi:hypothetical protein VDGL01_10500 [Verticillium dahliae]
MNVANRSQSALPTGPNAIGASSPARNASRAQLRPRPRDNPSNENTANSRPGTPTLKTIFTLLRDGHETDVHAVLRRIRDGADLKSLGRHIPMRRSAFAATLRVGRLGGLGGIKRVVPTSGSAYSSFPL